MKKNIYSLFLMALTLMVGVSCSSDNDIFDKSVSERSEEAIENAKKILTAQERGWVLDMYGTADYGGRVLLLKFTDDKVTAASEVNSNPVTTGYKVIHSSGTVLSFDDYNTVIHQFSDPARDQSGYGNNGTGFGADLEYSIISASPDSVVLLGRKHALRLKMVPAPTEWTEYFVNVDLVEGTMMASTYFYLTVGDKEYLVYKESGYRKLYITNTDNNTTEEYDYCVTDNGIRLLTPITTGNANVSEFTYNDSGDKVYAAVGNEQVSLRQTVAPLPVQLMSSRWYIQEMDEATQALWVSSAPQTKAWNSTYLPTVCYTQFGNTYWNSNYGYNLGFCAYIAYQRQDTGNPSGWVCIHKFSYNMIDANTIELSFTNSHAGSGMSIYNYSSIWKQVVNSFVGEFTITADNVENPSWLQITSTSDPSRWYKFGKTRPANWHAFGGVYSAE